MPGPTYPNAERLDLVESIHDRDVADPYRWLEDANDPRTVAWASEEDRLFEEAKLQWPGRAPLQERISELVGAGAITIPIWRADRYFLARRSAEQEHAVLVVSQAGGDERILLDPMGLDSEGTTTLDAWMPSKDGTRLA